MACTLVLFSKPFSPNLDSQVLSQIFISMASLVESEAVFRARAIHLGVTVAILDLFRDASITTMGGFAYSSAFQPGNEDETAFIAMTRAVMGRDATIGELSKLRRLYYECHTVALSELRTRVERTDDSKPARIQPAERAVRYEQQQLRLPGIVMKGPYECSRALIDKVFQMLDDNVLKYIPMDELTTRTQEILGDRKDADLPRTIQETRDGFLKSSSSAPQLYADLQDNLKMKEAFYRRALAFDQAGLITFGPHQTWIEELFRRLAEPPLPNYQWLSMGQIITADQRLFIKMAEDTRTGIAVALGQPRPLDVAMVNWTAHADILYLLATLPAGSKGKGRGKEKGKGKVADHGYNNSQEDQGYSNRAIKKAKGQGKGKWQKQKGKVKGKGKQSFDVPAGCAANTPDNRRICFSYNRPGGCQSGVEPGTTCSKGFHVCGKCFANHPCFDCH